MTRPFVSVVIPCRNESETIKACLESLAASDYQSNRFEVLVVDGSSTDTTRAIVLEHQKLHQNVRLLNNPRKTQQVALNIGIRSAAGDVIIRMDAHCRFGPRYIPDCVRHLLESGADNVGGRLVTVPRGETAVARAIALVMSSRFGVGGSRFRVAGLAGNGEPEWVDTVPYSCYRRDVFDRVGLFDERLDRSEDAEFHRRMKSYGCRTLFVPSLVSYYYARPDYRSFAAHALDNGWWAVLPTRYTGALVVSLRHLVPLAFVVTLIVLGVLAPLSKTLCLALITILTVYGSTSIFVSAIIVGRERTPRLLCLMPLVFLTLHILYGLGSLGATAEVLKAWRLRHPPQPTMSGRSIVPFLPEEDVVAVLLRVLLSREQPGDREVLNRSPAETARVAARHIVLLRIIECLEASGPVVEVCQIKAAKERERIAAVMRLIRRLGSVFQRDRIQHVFPKAFQHFPDMGHDLDLLVGAQPDVVLRTLHSDFRLTPGEGSISHWFADKRQYVVEGWQTPLEVHHGRLGHLGEHASFARLVLSCSSVAGAPVESQQLKPEHQLLFQVIQRMYGHFGFRASDVVMGVRSLTLDLDWDEIIRLAHEMRIYTALRRYTRAVNSIALTHTGAGIGPIAVPGLLSSGTMKLPYEGGIFRVSMAGVVMPLFIRAFFSAVSAGDWRVGLRLLLLPPLGIVGGVQRVLEGLKSR